MRPNLATNAIANYAGQVTTLVVGLLLTPLIVFELGDAMYGVWALVVAVQGLGGLLDFGFTTSVVKYVAEHKARDEIEEINRVAGSSFFLHLLIGLAAFVLTAGVAWFGLPYLKLSPPQLEVAQVALLVAAAGLAVGLPTGVLGSLLLGLRHYEISNVVNIVQGLATAALTVVALKQGGGPVALVAISSLGLAAANLAKLAFVYRLLPGFSLRIRYAERTTLKRIAGYSVWLFLLDAAKRVFYNLDAVLIAAFLPVPKVTAYNLGFKPASAISYLAGPLVSVFLPAASELEARNETLRLQRLFLSGTRIALALTLPAALWLLAFGRQVLQVWVGPGHEDALPVMYLFLGVFLVSAAQNPAGVILKGIGQVRPLAISVLVEYAANIGLSLLLIPRIGVAGAALGTLIPAAVNDLLFIPWLACRALKVPYADFAIRTLAGPTLVAVPALLILWPLSTWLSEPSLVPVLVGGAASVLLYGLFYLLFATSREEKAMLRERLAAKRLKVEG